MLFRGKTPHSPWPHRWWPGIGNAPDAATFPPPTHWYLFEIEFGNKKEDLFGLWCRDVSPSSAHSDVNTSLASSPASVVGLRSVRLPANPSRHPWPASTALKRETPAQATLRPGAGSRRGGSHCSPVGGLGPRHRCRLGHFRASHLARSAGAARDTLTMPAVQVDIHRLLGSVASASRSQSTCRLTASPSRRLLPPNHPAVSAGKRRRHLDPVPHHLAAGRRLKRCGSRPSGSSPHNGIAPVPLSLLLARVPDSPILVA